ncbi:hypothetical protein SKAU_G00026930 [Synaphobranchus kaupii]|uniref:Vesicle transport protein GOT1B n=1 Tax=Synaphobranchus kaupii TaxID=118154 RepID=A0A9Q1JEJ1_SYNKA|nr:hypothetical protein SKAU_G00026930 [Synaphobranchus kaupii]
MILFFDKALLAMGNILFVAGLSFVIGLERTFRFFFQKHKMKATSFFLGGVFVVLIGWPVVGVVLEIYGFFLLFRGFFPVVVGFIRRIPILGSLLNLPGISGFVDKVGESNNMHSHTALHSTAVEDLGLYECDEPNWFFDRRQDFCGMYQESQWLHGFENSYGLCPCPTILATFVSQSWSAPKDGFQRRNWTPQAMLYLKGAQGRRFVSEDRKEGDVYDTIHLETRSQNTEQRRVSQAASLLLDFLQQAREEGATPRTVHAHYKTAWIALVSLCSLMRIKNKSTFKICLLGKENISNNGSTD